MIAYDAVVSITDAFLTQIIDGKETSPEIAAKNLSEKDAKRLSDAILKSNTITGLTLFTLKQGSQGQQLVLENLKELSHPIHLNLNHSSLNSKNIRLIAELIALDLIGGLVLTECEVEPNTLGPILEAVGKSKNIERLDLSQCTLSEDNFESLSQSIKENHSLKKLNLCHTKMTPTNACKIASGLEQNYSIENLNIGYNQLDKVGIAEISNALIKRNRPMVRLSINFATLADDSAKIICNILSTLEVQSMDLMYNYFNQKNLQQFSEAVQKNPMITTLRLKGNKKFYPGHKHFRDPDLTKYPDQKALLDAISKKLNNNAKRTLI